MILHAHLIDVVIPTPETADTVGVWAESYPHRLDFPSMDVARSAPQRAHYHAEVTYLIMKWELRTEYGIYGTPG